MPTTALIRRSSGEVIKISLKGQSFADADPNYWEVQTDPPLPDGNKVRDDSGIELGPLRELGFAKIWDGADVRNATQGEIDGFVGSQDNDEKNEDADRARELLNVHPQFRKVLIAFADIIRSEINVLRQQHGLPERTLSQLKTAMLNRIDRDD
jgi:hypothetical protein